MAFELYLQLLSVLGLIISLYFVFIYHGIAKGSNKLVPKSICSEKTCHNVLQTKFARVFKVPNFYLGIDYYLIVFISTFFDLNNLILYGLLIISWFVVLFSIYLAYSLIFKLKTACNLCFLAQIINLVIGILFFLMVF